MTKRDNHYEAAFEECLRARRAPYVAVDEQRRSLVGERSLKNLDFIVSPPAAGCSWLVDIKGRRFPSGSGRYYWKNWSTPDDLSSLAHWERLFGARFAGLLVFAYWVTGEQSPVPAEELFEFRGRLYGFVGIRLAHYVCWARELSVRWGTISLPTRQFRMLARPLGEFFWPEAKPCGPGESLRSGAA